jgi:NAD(P)-dependent dehydrogenase (short-subunit alcohol dehydrogenase family)
LVNGFWSELAGAERRGRMAILVPGDYLTKVAVSHMKPGSVIINTSSINSDTPNPTLLPYATTKGAIQNFTAGLPQLLAARGIRASYVSGATIAVTGGKPIL